jgi:hypothetical protein
MKCNTVFCLNIRQNKYIFCKYCNTKTIKNECFVNGCKKEIKENYRCIFHLKYNSISLSDIRLNTIINYNDSAKYSSFDILDNIFYLGVDYRYHFYFILNINGEIITSDVPEWCITGRLIYYGPIYLKNKSFRFSESYKKYIINNNNLKEHILNIKIKNAIIIQKARRLCRYDPEYKMCSKVQLGELKRLSAL